MFRFIKDKIKFNKIKKVQFEQHIIFTALEPDGYFVSERLEQIPEKANDFNVYFKISDNCENLRINFEINNELYFMDINIKTENVLYFINFLESIYCFNSCDSLVYVSSNNNPNDFFCIKTVDPLTLRIMAILNVHNDMKIIDICIDKQDFENKFLVYFANCTPFDIHINAAKLLKKYSPKIIAMPYP